MERERIDLGRRRLPIQLAALSAAQSALSRDRDAAVDSIRRVARTLQGMEGGSWVAAVTRAAADVENAARDRLEPCLGKLVEILRRIAYEEEHDPIRVLIVEDDPGVRLTLGAALGSPGRIVLNAATLVEAERVLWETPVSVVVLDLMLPDGDGRSLLLRLRRHRSTAAVPVVVITSRATDLSHTECISLGADAFLRKPVDPTIADAVVSSLDHGAALRRSESRIDFLTGVANRAAFAEAYERASAHAIRAGEPPAVAILDLDGFKAVNDRWGHAVGDDLMRRLVDIVERQLRRSDLLARWGGDEFVVLFPFARPSGARVPLEAARQLMESLEFELSTGERFHATFSAGIVQLRGGETAVEAVAAADRCLYAAKEAGRNRIVIEEDGGGRAARTVLLVDDDPLTAAAVQDLLGREGYVIARVSADEEEAVNCVARQSPSLALIDVSKDGLGGGLNLLRRLRRMASFRRTPVILLAGRGRDGDVLEGIEMGADDWLMKPVAPAELEAVVARLLRRG